MGTDRHYKAVLVVCLLALASGGCRKNVDPLQGNVVDAGSDLGVRRPLVVSWAGRTGSVAGGPESISLYGVKTRYSVSLIKFAAGTRFALGREAGIADESLFLSTSVDLGDKIGRTRFDQLKSVEVELELSLILPDGRSGSVPLPPIDFAYGVREVMLAIEAGAVSFGEEEPDPHHDDCVVWPSAGLERFGKCGRVTDVDWIAISHAVAPEKATKLCGGYNKTSAGAAVPDLIYLLKDTEVTLYDRRSAGIVAKKVFAPDPTCPRYNFGGTPGATKDSPPPSEAVRAWLRTKPNR